MSPKLLRSRSQGRFPSVIAADNGQVVPGSYGLCACSISSSLKSLAPNNNRSVPEAVESIVAHNQVFHRSLKPRIVNYHALAKVIKSEVEKLTGKLTTVNTLVVAIKRFSDTLAQGKKEYSPLGHS